MSHQGKIVLSPSELLGLIREAVRVELAAHRTLPDTEHQLNAEGAVIGANEFLSPADAAAFLGISQSTVYKMLHRRQLPSFKPNGARVYVRCEDLEAFLKNGRRKSADELAREAATFVATRGKK